MGKFCTSCGTALNEGAKFCAMCGANAFHSNKSTQINTETPPEAAKYEQEISKTINSTKKQPPIKRASDDAPQQSPMGAGKFIIAYIRQSMMVLKNPKQMLPTALLGLVWLVLALLGSFGINPLPVRILSFLTFAQGGMFGGVLGAVGGILGKVVVATFLNAAIVPLFQKKAPFSGIGGGIKDFFSGLAVKSITAVNPLLGGVAVSLLLYAFMNSNQSLQNSMVGIIAFVMLLLGIGKKGGFLWGLVFSIANTLSKGKTPSYIGVTRYISGMTLGFALGVALSAIRLRWCGWLGTVLLVTTFVLKITAKRRKEAVSV
jgi:hypothetical protein